MPKFVYLDGLKFTRDDKTGYYLNARTHKRLHRYVWEKFNGEIPEGFEIHHIDGDKDNNDISNLIIMEKRWHARLHSLNKANTMYDRIIDNLNNNARPAACEWHGSEKGRRWHKEHYEIMKEKLHKEKNFVCDFCGKEFSAVDNGATRFCSNKCKSAYRRRSGVDNETRKCECCGKEFEVNKYSKQRFCSRSCSGRSNKVRKDKVD